MDNFLKKLNEQRDTTLQEVVETVASKIFEATTQTYLSQPGETTGHNLWVALARRNFQVFDAEGKPTGETLGSLGLYENTIKKVYAKFTKDSKRITNGKHRVLLTGNAAAALGHPSHTQVDLQDLHPDHLKKLADTLGVK